MYYATEWYQLRRAGLRGTPRRRPTGRRALIVTVVTLLPLLALHDAEAEGGSSGGGAPEAAAFAAVLALLKAPKVLRGSESFSFLVEMLIAIVVDMRYLLALQAAAMVVHAFAFALLAPASDEYGRGARSSRRTRCSSTATALARPSSTRAARSG